MTREEEEIMKLQTYKMFEGEDTVYVRRDDILELLEQEPCEDAISRQYLIERATSWDKHFTDSERYVSLTDIRNAPSVTPSRPTGHWIFKHFDEDTGIPDSLWCSECRTPQSGIYKRFCPNCGCRMFEPQERSDKE